MREGGEARAESDQRHLAAERPQRQDEPRGLVDVLQRRRLGDLDDQTGGDVAAALEARHQTAEPRPLGGRQAGDVDGEREADITLQLADRQVPHAVVYRAHEAELLDDTGRASWREK